MATLDDYKAEALSLGIQHSPNIGKETLKRKIADFKLAQEAKAEEEATETPSVRRTRLIREANLLKRVIITPLDPNLQDQQGTWAIASNSVVGTIKVYVPYNVEWHVPTLCLNTLRERKYTIPSKKDGEYRRMLPSLSIQDLPALTLQELDDLKKKQSLRESTF